MLTFLIVSLLLAPSRGMAQEDQPSGETDEVSRAGRSASDQARTSSESAWTFRWNRGPSLRRGDKVRLDFHARLQGDLRDSRAPLRQEDESDFDVSRRRIGVQGSVAEVLEFEIERELADDEPWRDVFVNYRRSSSVQVQAGKFKLPFSRDENTGGSNLDFVHRSRAATQLAPGRDRGVMVHGRVLDRRASYEVGLFTHDGANARTRSGTRIGGDRTLAGRVTLQPFRASGSALEDLEFGVALTRSHVPEGFSGLRGRTALDQSFFPPDFWVNGRRNRVGAEASWRHGPFSAAAEYIHVTTERLGQSFDNTDLSEMVASGWYLSGTWVVTGERKSRLRDRQGLLFEGGMGPIEVAARVEKLSFGSKGSGTDASTSPRAEVILPNSDRVVTLGVNWYVHQWAKIQANVIHDRIADPTRGPLPWGSSFWSTVVRFQLAL